MSDILLPLSHVIICLGRVYSSVFIPSPVICNFALIENEPLAFEVSTAVAYF